MTTRESLESMLRIETDTLTWQRETDAGYDAILQTMERIRVLNSRIEALMPNRPSSYAANYR
jgi:hypothetical protein